MEAVSEMVVPENELARPEQIDQFYKAIKLCRTIYDRPFIKLDHLPQLASKVVHLPKADYELVRQMYRAEILDLMN